MNVLFVSLGCDKNLVDTEMMLGQLLQKGYEFTDDETEADIVVVNTCCFIGDAKEAEMVLAMQILAHMLLKSQAAPMKKALSEAGIGKDVSGGCNDGILQPTFVIEVNGANKEDAPRFTFAVTMQNHGGYEFSAEENPDVVQRYEKTVTVEGNTEGQYDDP